MGSHLFCLVLVFGTMHSAISVPSHWNQFTKLRDGNCPSCRERLKTNVAEVLPRLSLIRHQIMNALGRTSEESPSRKPAGSVQKPDLTKRLPDIPESRPRTFGINELVSVSRNIHQNNNESIIRFQIRNNSIDNNTEPVGASLLLLLDRKRRVKKGGRGKKVYIEISSRSHAGAETWRQLAYFRTRIKRRRWKSISLPLNVAQGLLSKETDQVDLKVKCTGCGRLVQLVLGNDRQGRRKRKRVKAIKKNKVKGHGSKKNNPTIRQTQKKQANPILIISTRYNIP